MEKEFKKNVKVIPEPEQPPEGYTVEEWADLSDKEKEGVLMGIPDPGEEGPEEIDEDTLKKIAGEEEPEEILPS